MKIREKRVKLFFTNEIVRVSNITPEIYRLTLVYVDGYKQSFYRGFHDEFDACCYCKHVITSTDYCVDCYCEFIEKVDF